MTWLVTGGAGYIGAHVARALLDADMACVVLDDLSSGRQSFVPAGMPFVRGSILDGGLVERARQARRRLEAHAPGALAVAGRHRGPAREEARELAALEPARFLTVSAALPHARRRAMVNASAAVPRRLTRVRGVLDFWRAL